MLLVTALFFPEALIPSPHSLLELSDVQLVKHASRSRSVQTVITPRTVQQPAVSKHCVAAQGPSGWFAGILVMLVALLKTWWSCTGAFSRRTAFASQQLAPNNPGFSLFGKGFEH